MRFASPAGDLTGAPVALPGFTPSVAWQPLGFTPLAHAGCTIWGTAGNDRLRGTAGADVICGLGGDDRIHGRGGPDLLLGGFGDDTVRGGPGKDTADGGPGEDTCFAEQRAAC